MASFITVVKAFLNKEAGYGELRRALAELEESDVYIIAFSKRFTSGPQGWPFPLLRKFEESSPGHVGGVQAWTGLQMNLEQAMALLRYAARNVQFCRIEILAGGGERLVGREATDMLAAKGFHTSRPEFPDGEVPVITLAEVASWLVAQPTLGRLEVELAVDLGFAEAEQVVINGHSLLQATVGDKTYVLPDPSRPDEATEKALRFVWTRFYGQLAKADQLWPRDEMGPPSEGMEVAIGTSYSSRHCGPIRVIRGPYPGVIALEVFGPYGRYLWYSTDPRFEASESGWVVTHGFSLKPGAYLSKGYYRDSLPGESDLDGWDFARQLHEALDERFGGWLKFKVTAPRRWRQESQRCVGLKVQPQELADSLSKAGLTSRGEVYERHWDAQFLAQILQVIEDWGNEAA